MSGAPVHNRGRQDTQTRASLYLFQHRSPRLAISRVGVFPRIARWGANSIGVDAFGSWIVVGTPVQSGDKLSMRIEHLPGGQYRTCYHHNDQHIYEATRNWTFSTTVRHGVTCTPGGSLPSAIGEWDDRGI